jgi:hypothetical protein
MTENNTKNNIDFTILEDDDSSDNNANNFDINDIMKELENREILNHDFLIPQMVNYNENYTVKDLMLVCEYYGIAKDIKSQKYKKEMIINILVCFEANPDNSDIVFRRQNMWFYINELKNDKFMKKYILW